MNRFSAFAACMVSLSALCSVKLAYAQTVLQPPADAQAKLECLAICPRAFTAKLDEDQQKKLKACIESDSSCLFPKKPSGFLAGRDKLPDGMFGKQFPDILFNRPEAFRHSPGRVDG